MFNTNYNSKMRLTDFKVKGPGKTVLDELAPQLKTQPHDPIKQSDIHYKKYNAKPFYIPEFKYKKISTPKYTTKSTFEPFTEPNTYKRKTPTPQEDFLYKYVGIPKWKDKHAPSTLYYQEHLKGKTPDDILVKNLQSDFMTQYKESLENKREINEMAQEDKLVIQPRKEKLYKIVENTLKVKKVN